MPMKSALTFDHKALQGAYETRRYFAKFERITGHLARVTEMTMDEGILGRQEGKVVQGYLRALANTFTALSYKYLLSGRVSDQLPSGLNIDRTDSGFPIFQEVLTLANDALNAERHLATLPNQQKLKQDMVRHILNEHSTPTRLQFAMAQRLYYEELQGRALFWAQNDPQAIWRGENSKGRGRYLVHWASYDSQTNVPVVYLMELEDTGRTALPRDGERWPRAQSHLMAQAVSALKLVTIGHGFDQDFDDLHPKKLRRVFLGPMYSHWFTEQNGPLRDVLAEASGKEGLDWALAWTVETLWSKAITTEKTGFFSSADREVFKLAKMGEKGGNSGASQVRRSLILPQRAYQVLEEQDPPGMRGVRKYVLGSGDRILSYK